MTSLSEIIAAGAEARPEKTAIVFRDRAATYADLEGLVRRAAGAFHALGVGRGDRVALLLGNIPEFVATLHGACRIGAVATPINTSLTAEEVAAILSDAAPAAAVVDIERLPTLLEAREGGGTVPHVLVVGPPPTPTGTRSLDEVMDAAEEPPRVEVGEEDLALLAYTAGTTAGPKGVMLTHGNLVSNILQVTAVPGLARESDVALLALPLFHIYALNAALHVVLSQGATVVLVDRFEAAGTLRLVERYGVTVLFGVPPTYEAWLAVAASEAFDLSGVRLAVSGAAPLSPRTLEAFRERFAVPIWEGYGLTETSPVVTTNAVGPEPRPGSVGLPVPGVEIRLVAEDGRDAEEGDPGEILVRGPNVFRGYWNRPEETEAAFTGGWLRTGDVAYRDEDGYLFLVDRARDLIIVSGFNVYPSEVEAAIERHPGVAECAVVGVADERTGEAVKALVVPRPGASLTEEDVLEHCRGSLARFKLPREVELVEALPRHVTGKVVRRALRR